MLHKALRDNPRHHLRGVVSALPAAVAEREREGLRDVFGSGRCEVIRSVGHTETVAWGACIP